MSEIKEQIRSFIAQNLLFSENGYPHGDNASFLDEGIVDSMGVMELVAFTEDTFEIKIEDHEITPRILILWTGCRGTSPRNPAINTVGRE